MAGGKLWIIAYRDLLRNRRRSIFTLLAVALGLALLIVLNGFVAGILEDSLQNSIRFKTGHVQLRASSYQEEKMSLEWPDLLDNPEALADHINRLDQVKAAAPVLWVSGILNTREEAVGLQIFGIDPDSPLYAPVRESMTAGEFLAVEDRNGILMGKRLADSLGVGVGQKVNLAVVTSDKKPDEGTFTLRGLFSTGIIAYDQNAIFMLLPRAQAFTHTGGRASAIVILLDRQGQADQIAAALSGPDTVALTWRDLNQLLLETVETGMGFYVILDAIVMLVVAVIIANTLLMAVFERTREMGILAALGMKARQILLMFLFEAALLGLAGVVVGVILGSAGIAYLATVGIPVGEMGATSGNIALGSTMYARFVPGMIFSLSMWTLIIILLASLYPAQFAARLEPVDALRAL